MNEDQTKCSNLCNIQLKYNFWRNSLFSLNTWAATGNWISLWCDTMWVVCCETLFDDSRRRCKMHYSTAYDKDRLWMYACNYQLPGKCADGCSEQFTMKIGFHQVWDRYAEISSRRRFSLLRMQHQNPHDTQLVALSPNPTPRQEHPEYKCIFLFNEDEVKSRSINDLDNFAWIETMRCEISRGFSWKMFTTKTDNLIFTSRILMKSLCNIFLRFLFGKANPLFGIIQFSSRPGTFRQYASFASLHRFF